MICIQCGIDTGNDAQLCRKCGRGIGTVSRPATSGAAAGVAPARCPVPQWQPTKREPDWAVWVLLPILLLVVWSAAASSRQLQQLSIRSRIEQIANTPVTVNANGYYQYAFQVPPGARDAIIQGHISAAGGSGNDIEVYIFSKDNFENWRNGQQSRPSYRSGRVNRSAINPRLPADGVYYLVLNNQFSLVSAKVVQIDVTLAYNL